MLESAGRRPRLPSSCALGRAWRRETGSSEGILPPGKPDSAQTATEAVAVTATPTRPGQSAARAQICKCVPVLPECRSQGLVGSRRGVNRTNQAGAWRRGGGGALHSSLSPCWPRAERGGPGRAAGKCGRPLLPPAASGVERKPGANEGSGRRSTGGERRGRVLSAGWSPEAAPARPAARVSLGRGWG